MKLSPHCVTILQLILIFIYYKVYSITTLHKIYQKKRQKFQHFISHCHKNYSNDKNKLIYKLNFNI